MLQQLYKKRVPYEVVTIDPSYSKLVQSETVSNGVITRSSEFQRVSASEYLNQIHSSDFSLDNLLALGAVNVLNTPVKMRATGADGFIANVEHELNMLENGSVPSSQN